MDSQELHIFWTNFLSATNVEGTIGNVTFYKIKDWGYYARVKSSFTGKQVKTDQRFKNTMQHAAVLGQASACVAPVYNSLTEDWRCHEVYRKLTGIAIYLLREHKSKEEVQRHLHTALADMGYRIKWPEDELPPNLQQWLEEEQQDVLSGCKLLINNKGQLVVRFKSRILTGKQKTSRCKRFFVIKAPPI